MTSKGNVVLKALTHGDDLRICGACATSETVGGEWPKGHKATFAYALCPFCGQSASLAKLSDWDFPHWREQNTLRREW